MKILTNNKLKQPEYFKVIQILHDFGIHFDLLDLPDETDELKVQKSVKKLTSGAKAEVREQLAALNLKPCWNCFSIKELTEFNNSSNQSDGLATECKNCNANRCKTYREESNPEALDLESITHEINSIINTCSSILKTIGGK